MAELTYIYMPAEFVYLAVVMNVFTRSIRGWHFSPVPDETLSLTALQRALTARKPEIHHSAKGVQCAATRDTELSK